jgi:hypothetical protein
MQKELLIPAAILLGSAMIASGLYFGLQRRGPEPAAAPAAAPPAGPPQRPAAPAGAGLAPPPVSSGLRAQVQAAAAAALEQKRAELVQACWEPSFKKSAEPPQAKYIYNMTFDPAGKEIARGISEVRGMERSDTGQCLRSMPLDLRVPPPGAHVGVHVELMLP